MYLVTINVWSLLVLFFKNAQKFVKNAQGVSRAAHLILIDLSA